MLERRYRASSVRLNHPRSYESTAWIVGGYGSKNSTTTTGTLYLNQTSLISFVYVFSELLRYNEPAVKGPNLPFEAWGHCVIKCDESTIFIIGGQQNKVLSNKTWIVNPLTGFQIKEGPPMNVRRRGHSCGKMEKDGKTVLVVAGGFDESLSDLDSMEYLVLSDDQGWKLGKASLAGQFSIFNSKNSVKTIGANYQV